MPQVDRGDLVYAAEGRAAGEHLNAMSRLSHCPTVSCGPMFGSALSKRLQLDEKR